MIKYTWMMWRKVSGYLCDKKNLVRLKNKLYKAVGTGVLASLYGSECSAEDKR